MDYIEWYKNKLISILNEIYETQAQEIDRGAARCCQGTDTHACCMIGHRMGKIVLRALMIAE